MTRQIEHFWKKDALSLRSFVHTAALICIITSHVSLQVGFQTIALRYSEYFKIGGTAAGELFEDRRDQFL